MFKLGGTVTPGNSSQTSDGAAFVILMSGEKAAELGVRPIAKFISFAVAGVPSELMGIGPIAAIPKALKIAGLRQEDMDIIDGRLTALEASVRKLNREVAQLKKAQ